MALLEKQSLWFIPRPEYGGPLCADFSAESRNASMERRRDVLLDRAVFVSRHGEVSGLSFFSINLGSF